MISKLIRTAVKFQGKNFLRLKEVNEDFSSHIDNFHFKDSVSLYVHIPFCKRLCPYCSFNRYHYNENQLKKYFKNLKSELSHYINAGYTFSSVYFGGGTPTADIEELVSFFDFMHENLEIKQLSVETNPVDLNKHNLEILKAKGVKRLSVGIQSFDKDLLSDIGRKPFVLEDIVKRLSEANETIDTFNVDLIFNFPSQTITQIKSDIEILRNIGVDQITFYPLMPSPRRKTAVERKFNKIDSSREKRFYKTILDEMQEGGYKAATPWCFSRDSREKQMIDEYIVDYIDYIGIGSGAVSHLGGVFHVNCFSLANYGEKLVEDKLPVMGWRLLSRREEFQYFLITKLFGIQLDKKAFKARYGKDIHKSLRLELFFLKLIRSIQDENDGSIYSVTEKGMYHVSILMSEFFTSLNNLREFCISNNL